MTTANELKNLRERIAESDEIADIDRAVLDRFDDRLTLLNQTYTDLRHLKLLRHSPSSPSRCPTRHSPTRSTAATPPRTSSPGSTGPTATRRPTVTTGRHSASSASASPTATTGVRSRPSSTSAHRKANVSNDNSCRPTTRSCLTMLSDQAHRPGRRRGGERAYPAYESVRMRAGANSRARESIGLRVVTSSEIVTVRTRNDSSGVAAHQGGPKRCVAGLCHVRQRGGA